jgi:hypothetical protein
MDCPRCAAPLEAPGPRWCPDCERLYDRWVRRHASDIVWQSLAGTVVVSAVGLGLPLLGATWLVAAAAAFGGFGTIFGLARLTRRRRRRQFLQTSVPRAYLPATK